MICDEIFSSYLGVLKSCETNDMIKDIRILWNIFGVGRGGVWDGAQFLGVIS